MPRDHNGSGAFLRALHPARQCRDVEGAGGGDIRLDGNCWPGVFVPAAGLGIQRYVNRGS